MRPDFQAAKQALQTAPSAAIQACKAAPSATKQALQAAPQAIAKAHPVRRLLALLALAILGLVCLGFADALLRGGLWGEFVFAFLVVSFAIGILGHTLPAGLWERLAITPPTTSQAPFWALFMLVALPLALVLGLTGGLILLAVWLVVYFVFSSVRMSVLAGTIALLAYAELAPALAADKHVPRQARQAVAVRTDDLAHHFRPVLLFDSGELYAPVDIDRAITRGKVQVCRQGVGAHCDVVRKAIDIDPNADYLVIRGAELGPGDETGGPDSAIYYHLVDQPKQQRTYLDFWWYFIENPQPKAGEFLCSAGFRASERTCFRHAADWEGVTVVLAPCDVDTAAQTPCVGSGTRKVHVVGVRYAQHNGTKLYPWTQLRQLWNQRGVETADDRPLVFVARGSHASYPTPCKKGCGREGGYDGGLPWGNNDTCETAQSDCVQPLPLDAAGEPALWEAFPGPWGPRHCILAGAYCDGAEPPTAPSFHGRYQHPERS